MQFFPKDFLNFYNLIFSGLSVFFAVFKTLCTSKISGLLHLCLFIYNTNYQLVNVNLIYCNIQSIVFNIINEIFERNIVEKLNNLLDELSSTTTGIKHYNLVIYVKAD